METCCCCGGFRKLIIIDMHSMNRGQLMRLRITCNVFICDLVTVAIALQVYCPTFTEVQKAAKEIKEVAKTTVKVSKNLESKLKKGVTSL